MDQPITDPPVPYTGTIRGGFTPGKMVRIQGYVAPVGDRFNINFQTGPNAHPRDDVALHISVRLTQGYIARNSLQQGSWGEEQGSGTLPIGNGEKFEIIVLAEPSQYKIAVNGKHYTEFPHRIPLNSVTHLLIDGDVSLSLISWEGGAGDANAPSAPTFAPSQHSGPPPNMPSGPPPGQYGGPPPPQYAPYGPPQGGPYGPPQGGPYGNAGYPHPPGYTEPSGYESLLETAQTAIAGAISSGAAEKLLGGLLGGGGHAQNPSHPPPPQYQPPPPQQAQQPHNPLFDLSHLGGQGSIGGLGSVGSLLHSFAGQVFSGQQQHKTAGMPIPMPMPMSTSPLSGSSIPVPPASHVTPSLAMPMPPLPRSPNSYSSSNPPPYPNQYPTYNPPPYPNQYPTSNAIQMPPGYPPSSYPGSGPPPPPAYPYPAPPGPPPPPGYPTSHPTSGPASFLPASVGTALPFVAGKKMNKSKLKKAMKYGLPIAGAGVGAYALSKALHHGHHWGSSSSSSSSDSD